MNTTAILVIIAVAALALLALAFAAGFVVLVIRLAQRKSLAQVPGDPDGLTARLQEIEDAYAQGLLSPEEREAARDAALGREQGWD